MLRPGLPAWIAALVSWQAPSPLSASGKAKPHTLNFGAATRVPYSVAGDPAGNNGDEKEWTIGEADDVTDRRVAVRRALRLCGALPTDQVKHWVWQRGPWLLIDRTNGHAVALKLPFDPAVSNLTWLGDYAAYCGLSAIEKQLHAVVGQLAASKPVS